MGPSLSRARRLRSYAPGIEAPTCTRCATTAADDAGPLPLGWSSGTTDGRTTLLCADCTRAHTRDIEAKLDEEWWR